MLGNAELYAKELTLHNIFINSLSLVLLLYITKLKERSIMNAMNGISGFGVSTLRAVLCNIPSGGIMTAYRNCQ